FFNVKHRYGCCTFAISVVRFAFFLSDGTKTTNNNKTSDGFATNTRDFYCKIIANWLLASSYLLMPAITELVVKRLGNVCGLPSFLFKFTELIILSCSLNVIIALWQTVPEVYLWHMNTPRAENIHTLVHVCMWTISIMITFAIDVMEITGLKPICIYLLLGRFQCPPKSQQFDRFLKNIGFPGSSCLIIVLWAQKIMSFDRLVLAVTWTLGIISYNKTEEKDIVYVLKQIEKKKKWMYYSECIAVYPLK
ncbi:nurim, partial [Adelges cooleyi]|uniref:nurim n=1 Tax=Adelges cooleyi TaxID=133065 RepID=UPI0021808978